MHIGRLVGNQSDGHLLAGTLQLDHFAGGRVFRNIISSETGTDVFKESIQIDIFQGLVYLHGHIARTHNHSHTRNPLKISVMGYQQDNPAPFVYHPEVGFLILVGHPFAKFFLRHAQHFHIFEHIVAKIMKELAFDGLQFCCRLFRKRVLQVGTYHLPPVTDHMIQPEIDKIGQCIQYRKRKNSQKPHSYIGQQIEEFRFHVYCVIVPFSAVPSSLKSPKRTFTTLLSNAASLSTSTRI